MRAIRRRQIQAQEVPALALRVVVLRLRVVVLRLRVVVLLHQVAVVLRLRVVVLLHQVPVVLLLRVVVLLHQVPVVRDSAVLVVVQASAHQVQVAVRQVSAGRDLVKAWVRRDRTRRPTQIRIRTCP